MDKHEMLDRVSRKMKTIWLCLALVTILSMASIATIIFQTPLIWFYLAFGGTLLSAGNIFYQLHKISRLYDSYARTIIPGERK